VFFGRVWVNCVAFFPYILLCWVNLGSVGCLLRHMYVHVCVCIYIYILGWKKKVSWSVCLQGKRRKMKNQNCLKWGGRIPSCAWAHLQASTGKRSQQKEMGLVIWTSSAQQGHNTSSHWGTPSCEGVLCPCCAPEVQIAFSKKNLSSTNLQSLLRSWECWPSWYHAFCYDIEYCDKMWRILISEK
jgi:hypothetical protein